MQLRLTDASYLSEAAAVIHRVLPDEPVLTPEAGGLNVPLVDADQAAEALIALRQHGISVESVSVAQPTLDEVFLALTGHDTGESDVPDAPGTPDASPDVEKELEAVR
jgi:ABC-2 type transport system ATP-binding protein